MKWVLGVILKAIILNSQKMDIQNIEDLDALLPDGYSGKALNYGQGEGQIEISGSVWGFYVNLDSCYVLQYEEGDILVSSFVEILSALEARIKDVYGDGIQVKIQGMLNHHKTHEKYF